MVPEGVANLERWIEQAFPAGKLNLDHNTEEGRGHLERYWVAVLQGLKRGGPKSYAMKDCVRPVDFISQ